MARARRLVGAIRNARGNGSTCGAARTRASSRPPSPPYFAGVLRALGYRVRLHLVPFGTITMSMRKRVPDLRRRRLACRLPRPVVLHPQFFGCGGGNSNGYYCNPALDRAMPQASQLELTDPARPRPPGPRSTTSSPTTPPGYRPCHLREVDLASRRLGNYQYNPVWGFLADQSWVR